MKGFEFLGKVVYDFVVKDEYKIKELLVIKIFMVLKELDIREGVVKVVDIFLVFNL